MSDGKMINFPHCDTSKRFWIRTCTTKLKNICLFDLTFLWLTGILRIGSHLQIETVPRPLPSFWRYSSLPFLRSYGCERKEKRHSSNDNIIHIRTTFCLKFIWLVSSLPTSSSSRITLMRSLPAQIEILLPSLCSRNFQNVKLKLDFVEIWSLYRHYDFT